MFTWAQGVALENQSHQSCGTGLVTRLAGPVGRSVTKAFRQIGFKLPRSPKTAALAASLVISALLTAATLRLPAQHWLAWISFLPLFVVVRLLPPPAAALAGAFWGACLYLFCSAGPTPAVEGVARVVGPSAGLLALLIVIPAVYVGLAARPARAIGFKLLTLALGWTLIEVVLAGTYMNTPEPLAEWNPGLSGAGAVLPNQDYSASLHQGLLTDSQGEDAHLHWLARLLGYVATGFLVACANASLVGVLWGARLSFPAHRSLAESLNAGARVPSQVVLPIQSWALRQAQARAPPILVVPPNGI